MNTDFRVSVSLPTHPKALKLMRRLGDRSFYCLIRFWSFVAQNRPDGDITGLDTDDIEIACDWQGDAGSMHRALLDLCFIECIGDKVLVHDWEDHNGFAFHARERSEKAKKAAEARWERRNNAKNKSQEMLNDAQSNATSMQLDAQSNAPSPSPSPNPSLKENNTPPPPKGVNGSVLKSYQYPEWLNKGLWSDFCKMRIRIKKPVTTERTVKNLLSALERLMQSHSQDEIIQESIDHCWQDFYPPKQQNQPASNNGPTQPIFDGVKRYAD